MIPNQAPNILRREFLNNITYAYYICATAISSTSNQDMHWSFFSQAPRSIFPPAKKGRFVWVPDDDDDDDDEYDEEERERERERERTKRRKWKICRLENEDDDDDDEDDGYFGCKYKHGIFSRN